MVTGATKPWKEKNPREKHVIRNSAVTLTM